MHVLTEPRGSRRPFASLGLVIAAGLLLGIGLWSMRSGDGPGTLAGKLNGGASGPSVEDGTPLIQGAEIGAANESTEELASSGPLAVAAFAPTFSRADLKARKIPIEALALSREEAAWLRRNGYPTPSELENLDSLDLADLQRRAAGGDAAAMVLFGMRLGGEDGSGLIQLAQVHGSRFALLEYHRAGSAMGDTISGNMAPYQESAFISNALVAAMLGDHRASEAVSTNFRVSGSLNHQMLGSAMEAAQRWLGHLNHRRAQLGLPPLRPDPRPGFSDWEAARAADQYPLIAGRGG